MPFNFGLLFSTPKISQIHGATNSCGGAKLYFLQAASNVPSEASFLVSELCQARTTSPAHWGAVGGFLSDKKLQGDQGLP